MELVLGYEYTPAAHLLVIEEDAANFLQSQFSNDLSPFEKGKCIYGLWLDVKGKVIADSMVLCENDEQFRVFSEHSPSSTIKEKLERHIIADDVLIQDMPASFSISVVGIQASAILERLGFQIPPDTQFNCIDEIVLYKGRRSLVPSYELTCSSAEKRANLRRRLVEQGVEFISKEKMQLIRLEAGIPTIPDEIGPTDLPGEGGLVGAGVSISKGCYLGQEVVARMYNVGRAQRALFVMSGSGKAPVCPLALYNSESKQAGELRSAYQSSLGWKGVALLKIRHVEVGKSLEYERGRTKIECLLGTIQNAKVELSNEK